jgi:hypothetical protein
LFDCLLCSTPLSRKIEKVQIATLKSASRQSPSASRVFER